MDECGQGTQKQICKASACIVFSDYLGRPHTFILKEIASNITHLAKNPSCTFDSDCDRTFGFCDARNCSISCPFLGGNFSFSTEERIAFPFNLNLKRKIGLSSWFWNQFSWITLCKIYSFLMVFKTYCQEKWGGGRHLGCRSIQMIQIETLPETCRAILDAK